MVQEGESSTLSSQRAVTATGEPDGVVISILVVFGYHTQRLVDTVVMNQPYIGLADILDIRLILDLECTDGSSYGEQTACKKPFGQVVVIT